MDQKTPLYQQHLVSKGKIVPFAGFLLPVQYESGIIFEHKLVREHVGLFDVSHMGEFTLKGPKALANLNYLLSNDHTNMVSGQIRYSILCYENGTTIDDLLVYKKADDDYLLVVNASNIQKDYDWIKDHLFDDVCLKNISDQVAQIAIQGPKALQVITKLTANIPVKNYSFKEDVDLSGINCLLSRTGYTGEDGFEIYCDPKDAEKLWCLLLETGTDEGIRPCGLGARDTLRLEAAMPLYGHELSDQITPLESNLKYFVKTDKNFIGKDALMIEPKRQRVGFVLQDRGIARENCDVYLGGELVGQTTSGTFSPTLEQAIAMALLDKDKIDPDKIYEIDVRGRKLKAKLTPLPFYKRKKEEIK
ncbi:MAG: glycine cleavage system aminomethyltransferase GcvT [Erysipelotrichaceae bacterium]|nr:glycine cleavage system aminomethyltransferase GcvT [Erysipelotrichaceae bacterium]